jgi:hypothetical protein
MIIAECGVDMGQFPFRRAPRACAVICPGMQESGSKGRSGTTRPGPEWLRQAYTESACTWRVTTSS